VKLQWVREQLWGMTMLWDLQGGKEGL
jgi:hypothetical protein